MPRSTWSSDDAVTEVVGQILIFGILSVVLTMSLLSFNVAKHAAEDRIVGSTAEAVAQQVADLVLDTALLADEFSDNDLSVRAIVDIPDVIENRPYTIDLDTDDVTVALADGSAVATAPLFAADGGSILHICDQAAIIGAEMELWVVSAADYADLTDTMHADYDPNVSCPTAGGASFYLFLYP